MRSENTLESHDRVLVIGGGVGGIKTAMDLSEAGRKVLLIDKAFSIGGIMTQLDRTFPTNNCDLCTLSPQLSESGREFHIELMPGTQLAELEGKAGRFMVTLTTRPRYIDLNKCTACGECHAKFPECVRFTPGLDHRAPTCMRYPQATSYAFSIDMEKCADIEALVNICPTGAIKAQDTEVTRKRKVGAIVLASGGELYDPQNLDYLNRGNSPDVVTGLEYERILSASGPTHGELLRPSDGRPPRRIAWIQCVGSRGISENAVPYCSSVCCMYALKEATVTRERFGNDIETVIFYMDMRTFGKDYELYYQRARNEYGVRFVRCLPHSVVTEPDSSRLSITYAAEESGIQQTENFDMVVLSTGFRVSPEMIDLAGKLGIELNRHHFARTSDFEPVATSKSGIYVAGVVEGPKDIPETMVQASAAACMASSQLDKRDSALPLQDEFPPERDITHEEPKIGVFVCDCGYNIGGVVNVDAVVDHARALSNVVVAEKAGHGCSLQSVTHIQSIIREHDLNRIVIGGCSPRTHERLFQDTLRKAGLNKYLVEIANIREQDSWVHMNLPDEATQKAKDLVRMAVASVRHRRPLSDHVLPMNKDILVVGGGVSGMNAALNLAEQGFKVYLVEQSGQLGGLAINIRKTLAGDDVRTYLTDLITSVSQHDHIEVLTQAIIVDHTGMPGMFKTGLQIGPRMYYRQIQHGATILATGALPHRPPEYLLDEHQAVVTQLDLDGLIEDHPEKVKSWDTIVMIQCVGSRTPENPNCSRICCQTAVKNALRILDQNPGARIYMLYRDMRTYGLQEDYFLKARERGVIFIRYRPEDKPEVKAVDQQIAVTCDDPILGQKVEIIADCLALSTGFVADDEATEDLAMIFHLNRTPDGYFLEDHVKLRPVDLSVPGFLVAGSVHAPKSISESIAQAQAAAGRAQAILAKDTINLGAVVARVDRNKCAACLACVRACPDNIPFINAEGYSEIDPARCRGCGTCAAECPAKAINLMQFEDDVIMAKLDGLLERLN